MPAILFTGYPGFLGSELLPRILGRRADAVAHCIVQPKFAALAEERRRASAFADRIRLVEGDITAPLGSLASDDVIEVWHLAAIYDLSVRRELGMRINVDGTRNIVALATACPRLERLHYVSTCYVSGRYSGVFMEDDLEKGQAFNNFYEETKYLAEIEVRRAMAAGLRATIYRPSVVVGDSATGATQKYDGPYVVMRWLMRQPRLAMLPVAGRPTRYRFNVVPRDFVIAAIAALSARADTLGTTFALADPDPLTVDKTIDAIAEAAGRTVLRVPVTKSMAKAALRYVPGMYKLMQIPPAAVDYFVHPTTYDTSHARAALAESGIEVPHFRDYLPRLVEFVRLAHHQGTAQADQEMRQPAQLLRIAAQHHATLNPFQHRHGRRH